MSAPADIPKDIEDRLALYFDNQATPEVVRAIEGWLAADPANARAFAEYGYIERMIYCAQKTEDASAVFALLAEAEENAEPDFSLLRHPASEGSRTRTDKPSITAVELWSVVGYFLAKGLRSRAGVIGSVAAVLLLGLILVFVFVGQGDTPGTPETAGNTPGEPGGNTARMVATLTRERGAAWDRQPSKDLYAGQKFTLTQGVAEVTTAKGAIAILQAPASFELLNNPNAIRLHSGKLTGICETRSSKGFVIRAPHMDLTDLGTRFEIDVDASGSGSVSVSEGLVRVALEDAPGSNRSFLLKESQSATLQRNTAGGTARIPFELGLHDTGRGLRVGDRDRFWTVNNPNDDSPAAPAMVSTLTPRSEWLEPGQDTFWLSMPSEDGILNMQGRYPETLVFEQAFNLPQDIDPASVRLAFRYIADDSLTVLLNDQPVTDRLVSDRKIRDPQRWREFTEVTLDKGFKPGRNVISMQVTNHDSTTAIGLRAEFGTLSGEREIKIGPGSEAAGVEDQEP